MLKGTWLGVLVLLRFSLMGQVSSVSDSVVLISTEQRLALQWTEFVFVDQLPPNETGGMGENWEVSLGHWSKEEWRIDWTPLYLKDENDKSLDSLLSYAVVLNSEFYVVDSLNRLAVNAGEGYGTFDHTEYRYFGDSVVIAITDCVGHCSGSAPTKYERYTLNAQGRPLLKVSYPLDYSYSDPFSEQALSLHIADSILHVLANSESERADTTIFGYAFNAHSLACSWQELQDVGLYVQQALLVNGNEEHQVYISNEPMETVITNRFGRCPRLLVFELYKNSAVYFWWNARNGKYYYCGVHGADGLLRE